MRRYVPDKQDTILRAGKAVQRLIYYVDINEYEEEEKEGIISFKEWC